MARVTCPCCGEPVRASRAGAAITARQISAALTETLNPLTEMPYAVGAEGVHLLHRVVEAAEVLYQQLLAHTHGLARPGAVPSLLELHGTSRLTLQATSDLSATAHQRMTGMLSTFREQPEVLELMIGIGTLPTVHDNYSSGRLTATEYDMALFAAALATGDDPTLA